MKKKMVGVIGAGQMGFQIGKVAKKDHDVVFFDIDQGKSKSAAKQLHTRYGDEIQKTLESDIIFLAVPGKDVIECLEKHHTTVSKETLWVNISTFVTLKDMKAVTRDASNMASCKIIGHSEMMSPTSQCVFVIHHVHPENELMSVVEAIFEKVGITIYDDESKYLEVNYIAAAESMRSALHVADILRSMDISYPVIEAAVKQILTGTASQFPYEEHDYFHDLVYQRNPGLKELNSEILKLK